MLLHAPLTELAQRVPPNYGTLEAVGDDRCLLRAGADWLGALAVNIALLKGRLRGARPARARGTG